MSLGKKFLYAELYESGWKSRLFYEQEMDLNFGKYDDLKRIKSQTGNNFLRLFRPERYGKEKIFGGR
ncbi:hypothetical protein [Acetobacter cerevisiae]|uniref:hypothetical protein n=1 Tax=Acetobacter cerevisiae TaxID=178900 RepID=UPI0012E88D10|nr:hypothetical protein [Acetobacter cerevisiae]